MQATEEALSADVTLGVAVDPQRFVNIMEACIVAGVTRRTIYNWLAAGRLETKRTAGGSIRIRAGSLFRDTADTARAIESSGPHDTPRMGRGLELSASSPEAR